VGVSVGVGVRVGVTVRVGVLVGDGVTLGVTVWVIVALGLDGAVGVVRDNKREPQLVSPIANPNTPKKVRTILLLSDIKKRVMIIDLVVAEAKGIIPIVDISLG